MVCSGMFATCESFHFLAAMHMSAHTYMAVSCACYSQYSVVCLVECTVHHMVCKIWIVKTVQCNLQHTYELLNAGGVYDWFKRTGNTWKPKLQDSMQILERNAEHVRDIMQGWEGSTACHSLYFGPRYIIQNMLKLSGIM